MVYGWVRGKVGKRKKGGKGKEEIGRNENIVYVLVNYAYYACSVLFEQTSEYTTHHL